MRDKFIKAAAAFHGFCSATKIHELIKMALRDAYTYEDILKWLKYFRRRFFARHLKCSCPPNALTVDPVTFSPGSDQCVPSELGAELRQNGPDSLFAASMGEIKMWVIYALFSAFFAALTSVLAKIGIEGVNSNLATAIRTVVVLVMAWLICFITGSHAQLGAIGVRSWIFLVLSGLATGVSWLLYFRALQIGEASKVISVDKFSVVIGMALAFIILRETASVRLLFGGVLITLGTIVLVF